MTIKLLTDKRGPLQGVSLDSVIRNAYGPRAQYTPDDEGVTAGLIVGPNADVLDSVVEMHEVGI